MNFTNKNNWPNYIADWCVSDDYEYSDNPYQLSVTTLFKPIQAYWLSVRHHDQLSMDISDLAASRRGSAIHDSIEKVKSDNCIKEVRTNKEVVINSHTYTISGKFDILEQVEDDLWQLRDIKTTSVWSFIYDDKDEDYQKQLSMYRWLNSDKYKIKDVGFIDFFFMDWQSSKAKMEDNYPSHWLMPAGKKINLLSLEDTENYMKERITLFDKYRHVVDNKLPPCTPQELWAKADSFAIMKKDARKATKLCNSKEEAEQYMSDKKIKGFIQFRPGKVKRCKYCAAASMCSQYTYLVKLNLIDNH